MRDVDHHLPDRLAIAAAIVSLPVSIMGLVAVRIALWLAKDTIDLILSGFAACALVGLIGCAIFILCVALNRSDEEAV